MRGRITAVAISIASASLFHSIAIAQSADPVASGAPAGYEIALSGSTVGERGHALTLVGVAYESRGLADLAPTAGLELDVTITARQGQGRSVFASASARTTAEGRFTVDIDVPAEPLGAPLLELELHRPRQPGRHFAFPFSSAPDEGLDLLTDRNRYQPGEQVRAWLRVRGLRASTPHASRRVKLTLMDMSGQALADHEARTGPSGVVTADLALPQSAEAGSYRVIAEVLGDPPGPRTERTVQVWRRTVERLLGRIELLGADEDGVSMVAPGGRLRGRVVATTPSGTPVRDATVELRVRPDAPPTTLTTDDQGRAQFDVRAPTYLAGDVGSETLSARIVHAAHGTIVAQTGYLMARVRAVVSVTARGGALVPEVRSTLYVSVSDPRGRPLPTGTEVAVRGAGIAGGQTVVTTDDKGFAELAVELPRGAASTMRGGECAGQVATTFELEVRTDPARTARVCARVSAEAEVVPVALGAPIVAPGTGLEVEVLRRPGARGRPVLVEALFGGRAVAFAWVDGRTSRATLALPADLLGLVTLRARASRPASSREPASEPGASGFGVGGFDALLVRPADTFALTVVPERARYFVREHAEVRLTASRAPDQGWAALLVRDEAAHGGEGPWELRWMQGALQEAAERPADQVNARLLRASLSGALGNDPEPPAPPPIEPPYWRTSRNTRPYRAGMQMGRGILRDPVSLREEMLRRGVTPFEITLERAVRELGSEPSARAPIVEARGGRSVFHPNVIANLVAARRLSASSAVTLGGEPLTVAMIEREDPGFSFDTVAKRVARERLSRLLMALLHLTDPDDTNAQRASANLPPERWLGTLVQLGMVQARDLTDPWGHAYVFRRIPGHPRVAVSERALDWELASPGPDGRLGSADDVKDPFARAVPEGTPYAVASGEESLLRRFASLAPSQIVLSRMGGAYARLGLAAQEEQQQGPVTASSSETSDEEVALAEEADMDDMVMGGMAGEGGGGSGYGRGGGRLAARAPAAQAVATPATAAPAPEPAFEQEMDERRRGPGGSSRAEAMGAMIREDFPATLFFVGEVPLSGATATVDVPLADALTTYRLEAIAWTASGWTTSGAGRLSVDQEALIDAPVPEWATVGDVLRLPIRVENRTDAPLPVQILIEAEGEIGFDAGPPVTAEIPAHEAQELVARLSLSAAGEGALVVSVARQGGGPLDAVRRPIRVLADARTARDRRERLIDGTDSFTLEIPAEASERGPAHLRVAVGARLFGELDEAGHPLWAAWSVAIARQPLPESLAESVFSWVSYEDYDAEALRDPLSSALALSATWREERLSDADAARALRSVGQRLPAPEAMRQMEPEAFGEEPAWLLLALAPVAADLDRRPALREDATRLLSLLRRITSTPAARATDAPEIWSRAAAALALSGGDRARAEEMVRRTGRHLIRVGEMAWVEPERPAGGEPRAQPTALLALAEIALGHRESALSLVRALIDMQLSLAGPPPPWIGLRGEIAPPEPAFHGMERALAGAAASRLSSASAPGEVRVWVDGQPVETTREGEVSLATIEHLARPGTRSIRIALGEGSVALAHLALAYGMPWDVAPRRRAPIDIAIEGELGARETRAAIRLEIQNRGARILTRPIVELELPAGAELDEPTREALATHLRGDAHMEGRTLLLPLRPLAPGGFVRLPIPARWAVGGTLRGLGAVAYDAAGPERADILPVAVLPSRAIELADRGAEPEAPEAEASEPPTPLPPPIPILERLVAGEARR